MTAVFSSSDDRHRDVAAKLDAYCKWGVPHIWLIDPWMPHLNVYNEQGLLHVPALEVPEFGVRIALEELMTNL